MKNNRRCGEWLILLFGCLVVSGCDIINPDETLPTTIHLEPFSFEVDPGQGSSTNSISEVWVTANGNILGVFAPPVDIRYLETGPTTFRFYPGIRNNGIANDAIPYTFFASDSAFIDASPGTTLTVNPETRYIDAAVFSFLCDFETGNPFVDNRDTNAFTSLELSQDDVFEGMFSGKMTVTDTGSHIKVANSLPLTDLPIDGKAIYLEMWYKSEVEFSIGLVAKDLSGLDVENFFYLVKPSSTWNQLYLELTDPVEASGFPAYKIAFQALYLNTSGDTARHIYLDNIKVVHR
jgi:hypothetical protein